MSSSGTDRTVSLDAIPSGPMNFLTLLDRDGTVQYESPSIERVLGYDQDELVDDQFTDSVHPEDRDRVAQLVQKVTADRPDTIESGEYRHKRPDGSYVWVKSAVSTEPTAEGRYLINTVDISDRRSRESDAEPTDDQLYEFAKVVSHDLRNPLNVASGNVRLLDEEIASDSEIEKAYLRNAICAHQRMETLISDLLTLVQSGSQITERQWIEFRSLCETCWQNVATGNATLVIEADREILADRSRLQQLFENLIRNAVDHGGDAVTITIGESEDRSGFYLADDGTGIPEAKRDQVFESGFSTIADGTGYGLAIVSEIVEAHEWEIDVTESDRGGARFEISGVEWRDDDA